MHDRHSQHTTLLIHLDQRIRAEWCIAQTQGTSFTEAVKKEYNEVVNDEFYYKLLEYATNNRGKGKGYGNEKVDHTKTQKGHAKGSAKGQNRTKGDTSKGAKGDAKGKGKGKGKPQNGNPIWWEDKTTGGKTICRRFQTGFCNNKDCSYEHVCGVPGCGQNHAGMNCPHKAA